MFISCSSCGSGIGEAQLASSGLAAEEFLVSQAAAPEALPAHGPGRWVPAVSRRPQLMAVWTHELTALGVSEPRENGWDLRGALTRPRRSPTVTSSTCCLLEMCCVTKARLVRRRGRTPSFEGRSSNEFVDIFETTAGCPLATNCCFSPFARYTPSRDTPNPHSCAVSASSLGSRLV